MQRATQVPEPRRRDPGGLTLVVDGAVPAARLHVVGDLDICTAPQLARRLAELHEAGYRTVDLDLSRLAFLGAAGLAVFCEATARLHGAGGRLRLLAVTPHVRRLVGLVGLDAVLLVEAVPARTGGRPAVSRVSG